MALQFGPTGCITLDGTTAATVTEWTADLSGVLPVQPCELGWLLGQIEAHDQDYAARYGMVLGAVAIASTLGYAAGFRIDPDEPGWPVAYIELPTGQVSWHMPQHDRAWDGHTTADKYDRCRAFAASLGGVAPYGPIV